MYARQRPEKMDMDILMELVDNAAIISANNLKKQSISWFNKFSMPEDEIENLVALATANVMMTLIHKF